MTKEQVQKLRKIAEMLLDVTKECEREQEKADRWIPKPGEKFVNAFTKRGSYFIRLQGKVSDYCKIREFAEGNGHTHDDAYYPAVANDGHVAYVPFSTNVSPYKGA